MRRPGLLLAVLALLGVPTVTSSATTTVQTFGPAYSSAWSDPCTTSRDPVDPVGVTVMRGCSSASTSGDLATTMAWRVLSAGTAYGQRTAVAVIPLAKGTEHAFVVRVTAQVSGQVTVNGLSYARTGLQLVMGDGAPCNVGNDECVLIPTRGEQFGVFDAYYTGGGMQMGVESVLASVTPAKRTAAVARTVVLTATMESYRVRTLAAGSYPMFVRIGSQMYSGVLSCAVHVLDGCVRPGITPGTGTLSTTARILSVTVTPTAYRALSTG